MAQAKKKLGWKINAEIDKVEKKMSRKGTTNVVKQHVKRVKATSAFIEDVHVKLASFVRSSKKTEHHARVLGETFFSQSRLYSHQHETELSEILQLAGELMIALEAHSELINDKLAEVLKTKDLFVNNDYKLAKELKDKYNKTRANYDASVEKVKRINAKKGQVNLAKLADAEAERDKLKEELMQEQVRTGIQLQETLAQSAVDISSFLAGLFKARYKYFRAGYEVIDSKLPLLIDVKRKIKNAGDALPSLEKKNPTAVKVVDPLDDEEQKRKGIDIKRSHSPSPVHKFSLPPLEAPPVAAETSEAGAAGVPTSQSPPFQPLSAPLSPRSRHHPLRSVSTGGRIHQSIDEGNASIAVSRMENSRRAFVDQPLSMRSDSALHKYFINSDSHSSFQDDSSTASKAVRRKSLEPGERIDTLMAPPAGSPPLPTSFSEDAVYDQKLTLEGRRRGSTSPARVSPEMRRKKVPPSPEDSKDSLVMIGNSKLSRDKLGSPSPARKHGFKVPKKFKKKKSSTNADMYGTDSQITLTKRNLIGSYDGRASPPPSAKSKLSRTVMNARRKTGDYTEIAQSATQMAESLNNSETSDPSLPTTATTTTDISLSSSSSDSPQGDEVHSDHSDSEKLIIRVSSVEPVERMVVQTTQSPPSSTTTTPTTSTEGFATTHQDEHLSPFSSDKEGELVAAIIENHNTDSPSSLVSPTAEATVTTPRSPEDEQQPQQIEGSPTPSTTATTTTTIIPPPLSRENSLDEWHVALPTAITAIPISQALGVSGDKVLLSASGLPSTPPLSISPGRQTPMGADAVGYTPSPPSAGMSLTWNTGDYQFPEEDYTNLLQEMGVKSNYVFEALRLRKRKAGVKTAIVIDLTQRTMTFCTSKREPTYSVNTLLQMTRSQGDTRKIYLMWKNREKREKYMLKSCGDRELFYSVIWFMKNPKMDLPRHRFRRTECIELFIGNWNLGDATPPSSLVSWIPRDKYDMYAIAVQECKYPPRFGNSSCEGDWFGCIQSHLGPAYIKMAGLSLLSIRLLIMVRREHYYKISNIEKGTEATGIANVVGNKGGIGVSFSFNGTNLCFIGAHLAAHQEMVDARNKDFHSLLRGLATRLGTYSGDLHNQFHHLFFFGDLNYRIDLERQQVIELVKEKSWATLRAHDQLKAQQEEGKVFRGFQEGELAFPPTYRYNRGDREYSEEKMRIPAYTDRILWRSLPESHVAIENYQSHDEIMTSDHSPISASFMLDTLLPPLPFEEPEEKCVIIITNLHAVDIGRHRKWKKLSKKEEKEERKREKQEKKKELKEMKRELKASRKIAKEKKKEKKRASYDSCQDEDESDLVDTDYDSSAISTADEDSSAIYGQTCLSDSEGSLSTAKRGRMKKLNSSKSESSPERERKDPRSLNTSANVLTTPEPDWIPRPQTDYLTRRRRSKTDNPPVPLPEFSKDTLMMHQQNQQQTQTSRLAASSKKIEKSGLSRSASRSFSELPSLIADDKLKTERSDKIREKKEDKPSKDSSEKHERIPNPFIVFSSPILESSVKTGVQIKTCDPRWSNEDVPVMELIVKSKHYLKRQYLFIAVRDHRSMSSMDDIGQGVLSLRNVCKAGHNQAIDFSVDLLDRGTPAGKVSGTITIRWGDGLELKTPEKKLTRKEKRLSKKFVGMEPLLLKQSKGGI